MPFNGSGGFVSLSPPDFPAVPNTTILSDQFNNSLNDIFLGLGQCVTRDGQSPATANLPMGGFKHTGAAAANATGQYLVYGQAGSFSSLTLTGDLAVEGNTTLGNASSDALTIHPNAVTWQNNPTHSGDHGWSGRLKVGNSTARQVGSINHFVQIEHAGPTGVSVVRNSNDTGFAALAVGKTRGASVGANTAVAGSDTLGRVEFCGADGSDIANVGAFIAAVATQAWTTTAQGTRLEFHTTPAGSVATAVAMTVEQDKSVTFAGSTMAWSGNPTHSGDHTWSGTARFGTAATNIQLTSGSGIIRNHTTGSVLDMQVVPADGTGDATVRMHRATNTTGVVSVQFLRGNNSTTSDFTFTSGATSSAELCRNSTAGTVRINGSQHGTLGVRQGGNYGGAGPNTSLDDLVIENSSNAGISILTPNSVSAYLLFGDPESNTSGGIDYNHAIDELHIRTATVTRLTVNATGTTAAGLLFGRGGGAGLGQITVSTSAPSGGANGDIWLQY